MSNPFFEATCLSQNGVAHKSKSSHSPWKWPWLADNSCIPHFDPIPRCFLPAGKTVSELGGFREVLCVMDLSNRPGFCGTLRVDSRGSAELTTIHFDGGWIWMIKHPTK